MTRDYKNLPRSSARSGHSGKTIVTGIVIGLLLGIVIALGIALFLNRSPSPFVNKGLQREANKPGDRTPVETKRVDTAKPLQSEAPPQAKAEPPRFDFYDILPGNKDPAEKPSAPDAKPALALKPAAAPKRQESAKTGGLAKAEDGAMLKGRDNYYLQAGSFRGAADADNLKARLALMGMEASVSAAELPNIGTMHRVRVGPFHSTQEITPLRSQLAKNGIQASVVKLSAGKM